MRNNYHSTIKMAFSMGIEKQWLPKEIIQSIPQSTSHGWKKESLNKFIWYAHAAPDLICIPLS